MKEHQLQAVYKMVDSVPFSRQKKQIGRDFSDGVMMAELLHHYNSKLVELHNYPPANSTPHKISNWNTLNQKALKKLGLNLNKQQIEGIVNSVPGVIEQLIYCMYLKFQQPEDEGSLLGNARQFERGVWQQDARNENEREGENNSQSKKQRDDNVQTMEILNLVAMIDEASEQLVHLRANSKLKDETIENLEKRLEKVIFNR